MVVSVSGIMMAILICLACFRRLPFSCAYSWSSWVSRCCIFILTNYQATWHICHNYFQHAWLCSNYIKAEIITAISINHECNDKKQKSINHASRNPESMTAFVPVWLRLFAKQSTCSATSSTVASRFSFVFCKLASFASSENLSPHSCFRKC